MFNYNFHRLEYRHCAAFAKTIMFMIDTLTTKKFLDDNNLTFFMDAVVEVGNTNPYDHQIFIKPFNYTRAGCLGEIRTHCFQWTRDCSSIRIDSRDAFDVDLFTDDLEAAFFQSSLIYEPNELLYIITMSYINQHCKNHEGFSIENDFEEIFDAIPNLKKVLEEQDFYEDFNDLYYMQKGYFDEQRRYSVQTN